MGFINFHPYFYLGGFFVYLKNIIFFAKIYFHSKRVEMVIPPDVSTLGVYVPNTKFIIYVKKMLMLYEIFVFFIFLFIFV
jgi:hypothetical protein